MWIDAINVYLCIWNEFFLYHSFNELPSIAHISSQHIHWRLSMLASMKTWHSTHISSEWKRRKQLVYALQFFQHTLKLCYSPMLFSCLSLSFSHSFQRFWFWFSPFRLKFLSIHIFRIVLVPCLLPLLWPSFNFLF